MNQRDQNQGGRRGGRGHPDEGGEQGRGFADERDHDPRSWRERLAAQFRDPHRGRCTRASSTRCADAARRLRGRPIAETQYFGGSHVRRA